MRIALLSAAGALLLPITAQAQAVPPPPDAGVPTDDAVGAPVPPESVPDPGDPDATAPPYPANSADPADSDGNTADPSADDTSRGQRAPAGGDSPSY